MNLWKGIVATASLSLFASPVLANEELDQNDVDDRFTVWAKLQCRTSAGEPVLWWWHGKMYSRRAGEKDRVLFKVQGMNIRNCDYREDDVRGPGLRSVSREVMFYLDPETEEVLETWENPFIGETVDVIHVQNDPVNMRSHVWARDENGEPSGIGDSLMFFDNMILVGGGAARLFYDNPLAGDYQQYIGGKYHAMEMMAFSANLDQALDPNTDTIDDVALSWGRVSNWLPWMKMGDREGMVVFNTVGMRLQDWNDLPDLLRNEIEANYPLYRKPPPVDDDRPNETTWTVFKRHMAESKGESASTDGNH